MPDPNPSRALSFLWIRRLRSRTFRASHLDPWGLAWSSTSRGFFLRLAVAARSAQAMRSRVCALGWVATKVPPRPGAQTGPMALEAAEKKGNHSLFGRVPPGRTACSRGRGRCYVTPDLSYNYYYERWGRTANLIQDGGKGSLDPRLGPLFGGVSGPLTGTQGQRSKQSRVNVVSSRV